MSNQVVILTGPPAAGKTTVAELLAADASVPTVHLTTDLFYRSIRTGFVLPFLPEAQKQNEVVIEAGVRPDLGTTVARAKERMGHELKDVGAITGLHQAFAKLGELERHAIDTGDRTAEQTSAEVNRILASGRYRLA